MIFYKDRRGFWHSKESFLSMADLFLPAFADEILNFVEYLKSTGCVVEEKEIDNPTVIDFLKLDMYYNAITTYCDIHKCTIMKARKMVDKIEEDIKRYHKS